jgi:hypothetical protein
MSKAEDLILGDQPLPESEILVTLDLFSEEKPLGPELLPKKVKEAEVSIGKWHIFFLPPVKSIASKPTPDRSMWDLYFVCIPFTLHEPPGDAHYQRVKFEIELYNEDATAFSLLPKNVTSKEEVTKTYVLSPQFNFKGIGGKVGDISYQIRFERLQPIINAFGEGESRFYWIYTSPKGQEVFPGTKHALIILEVPRGIKSVDGIIYPEVAMAKKLLGIRRLKDTKADPYPITWNLSGAKPFYGVEKSKTK